MYYYTKDLFVVFLIPVDELLVTCRKKFIEDHAFSPSYDLAPSPPLPTLARQYTYKFDGRHRGRLWKGGNFLTGKGGGTRGK
jgi:hypothetical protein